MQKDNNECTYGEYRQSVNRNGTGGESGGHIPLSPTMLYQKDKRQLVQSWERAC